MATTIIPRPHARVPRVNVALCVASAIVANCSTVIAQDVTDFAIIDAHYGPVMSISASSKAGLIATTGFDRKAKLWDLKSFKELAALEGHVMGISCSSFSPDGTTLATASDDRTIKLWDIERRKSRATISVDEGFPTDLFFSPDGKLLVLRGHSRNAIQVWNLTDQKEIQRLPGYSGPGHRLAFAPDGKTILAIKSDITLNLIDTATWKVKNTIQADKSAVAGIAIAPSGRKLAFSDRIFDCESRKSLVRLKGIKNAEIVAFSADDKLLVTTSIGELPRPGPRHRTGILDLWDAATGENVARVEMKNAESSAHVFSATFIDDGKLLVAATADGRMRVLDVKEMLKAGPPKK